MNKSEIRKKMKEHRKSMNIHERRKADRMIFKNLCSLCEVKQSDWLYLYVSYGTEADTIGIINYFLGKKHIAVPKVYDDDMEFYEIFSFDDLKEGYHGILEPVADRTVNVNNAVMIMPGLAFDISFNRIGYGGGYYDRYLKKNEEDNFRKIALAYDFQVLKYEIADIEEHDIKPDIIITEKNMYHRNKNNKR